jgi:hypothetical protein
MEDYLMCNVTFIDPLMEKAFQKNKNLFPDRLDEFTYESITPIIESLIEGIIEARIEYLSEKYPSLKGEEALVRHIVERSISKALDDFSY